MPERSPAPSHDLRRLQRRRAARAFTLIELVVVVVIVGLMAALATPAITAQMRDRRANQASQEIANFYRGARMRALGRGSAVLVRYQKADPGAPAGSLEVWEAVVGGDDACGPIPRKGCQGFAAPGETSTTQQLLNQFNPGIRGEYDGVDIKMLASGDDDDDDDEDTFLDVCFTPMGATYERTSADAVMRRMRGVRVAQVTREGSAGRRDVLILPGGSARVKGKFVEEAEETEAEGEEGAEATAETDGAEASSGTDG